MLDFLVHLNDTIYIGSPYRYHYPNAISCDNEILSVAHLIANLQSYGLPYGKPQLYAFPFDVVV